MTVTFGQYPPRLQILSAWHGTCNVRAQEGDLGVALPHAWTRNVETGV